MTQGIFNNIRMINKPQVIYDLRITDCELRMMTINNK